MPKFSVRTQLILMGCILLATGVFATIVTARNEKATVAQTAATAAPRHETALQKRADAITSARQDKADAAERAREEKADAAESGHQARVQMYAYWKEISAAGDEAVAANNQAVDALGSGNTVDASAAFSTCVTEAENYLLLTGDNVPDGWSEVEHAAANSASALEDHCKAAVSALDDRKPSEAAEAKSKFADFQQYQLEAVAKASELWEKAGGKQSDL